MTPRLSSTRRIHSSPSTGSPRIRVTDTIEIEGLRIAYERAGEGPPVMFLGGYVGDGPTTWRHQIDALSDEFTIVAWDVPGSGRSEDPPETWSLADFADCLAGFIGALGLSRPHVCGLSFGGGLALELYHLHPAVPRSLTLASAYAGWKGSLPPDEVDRRLHQVLRLSDLPPERFAREVAPTMFSGSVSERVLNEFAANIATFHPIGLRAMSRCFADVDLRAVLPGIEVPTLLLYGDADVRAPLPVGEEIHAAIPGSKLVVLPNVGHLSSIEAPERFNDELRTFLRSVPG